MITPEQEQEIHDSVNAAVDNAANIAEVVSPQFTAYIILGQAIAKAIPSLYIDVKKLIEGQEPTQAEKTALAKKIALLADPDSIV
jgi:hypothetical protein